MKLCIKNDRLTVGISELGAELALITDKGGTQYLWQGDSAYWARRAPNLFPYIGRLTDKSYIHNGKVFQMDSHGFASRQLFEVERQSDSAVTWLLTDNPQTRAMYPFAFALRVMYTLDGTQLTIRYGVENRGGETMYFGLGGHPGFHVPLEKGLRFEDYALRFDKACTPIRIGLSDTCFCTGEDTPYPLDKGCMLPLRHELFDRDAILLKNMARGMTLFSPSGRKTVRVTFPQMRYLGLWQRPHTDAPFLCIEPWTSLPSRHGVVEVLSQQENLIALPAKESYDNTWAIEFPEA